MLSIAEAVEIGERQGRAVARRASWLRDDLKQEAIAGALSTNGPAPYVATAARLTAMNLAMSMLAPVRAASHSPAQRHAAAAGRTSASPPDRPVDEDGADHRLHRARWTDAVLDRMSAVLDGMKNRDLAVAVLLGGEKPASVARRAGVGIKTVYAATLNARRRIAADNELQRLWRQR